MTWSFGRFLDAAGQAANESKGNTVQNSSTVATTEAVTEMTPHGQHQLFLTAVEASELFRLDESTMYRHLRAGTFPGLKIGGRYVVPRAVIDHLIADVLATGRCVDLGRWTEQWRATQQATERRDLRTSDIAGGQK